MSTSLGIGFLGAGRMATALASGCIRARVAVAADMLAADVAPGAREAFTRDTTVRSVNSNAEVVRACPVLVLAVKPDQVGAVLAEIRPHYTPNHLLISIAAGVPLARMEEALEAGARVVRVMPNTPALVGSSATGYAVGRAATAADAEVVQRIFAAVGVAFQVKEALLDAVTGLSGSGPAYAYLMIEALSDGGVAAGLPREVATRLAAQTLLGAARMVLETGLHPGALKDMVTSPGGTTIEGLHELEKGGLRGVLMSAVRAATDKSRRLGQSS